MKSVVQTCPTCGEKISPTVGECLYCPPPPAVLADAPAAGPVPAPVSVPVPVRSVETPSVPVASSSSAAVDPERAFGLLLFEAEENLARGHVEKALVHASRAVRGRPGDLTARSLFERARREATRGRRKEKLEARLVEARRLFDAQDFGAAEKIVGAALKLVPDNAAALELFGRLKERRLAGSSAEAEAERDLDRLVRERARRSADAARTALRAGAEFRALLTVRRALRLVPDAPELLAVLAEVQKSLESVPAAVPAPAPERHAMDAQVQLAMTLAGRGQLEDSLKILRAVLYEDIDFAPAQAAVQEVRRTWLARRAAEAKPVAPPAPAPQPIKTVPVAAPSPPVKTVPLTASRPGAAPAAPPKPALSPSASGIHRRPLVPGPPAGATPRPIARPAAVSAGPDTLRLPTRPHRTPWALVIGCGCAVGAGLLFLGRGERLAPAAAPPQTVAPVAAAPVPVESEPEGPLARVDPELRRAIQETLTAYGHALERIDPEALARARPDLSAEQRARLLDRYQGALNVASDLRVLDVLPSGDAVVVPVLRTDVIVGGKGGGEGPVEETLRFERSGSGWALRARR